MTLKHRLLNDWIYTENRPIRHKGRNKLDVTVYILYYRIVQEILFPFPSESLTFSTYILPLSRPKHVNNSDDP